MPRQKEEIYFGAADYVVFGVMLLLSLLIGIFYAVKDKKSEAVNVYLLGGRKMHYFPVAISLSLSFVSAVTILGIPAEIYVFGSMYYWFVLCVFIIAPVCTEIYIPLFYKLGITSSFEYLQLRFNYGVRLLATAAFILQNIMFIGVMIYAPAVALEAVTGFNLWAAIFSLGIVCTLYTTMGGLKAVIWSDVFQGLVVLAVMFTAMFVSASHAGGWDKVWERNWNGNRIDFIHFDFDPRVRHSFWSVICGIGILWTSTFATSQTQVQRYLCCSSVTQAKKALVLSLALSLVIVTLCLITGFTMYAYFYDCDPIRNGEVTKPDQLLPYLIMNIFREYPGLPGLFVAGVFAGSLSTVSSGINALACVTIQDYFRPFVKWQERTLTICSKVLVLLYGAVCIGFACLSTLLGNILQTSLSVMSIIGGPIFGVFTLGIIFPCAESYGVSFGLLAGIAISTWIYIGSIQYPTPLTSPYYRMKMSSIVGCIAENSSLLESSGSEYLGSGNGFESSGNSLFQTTFSPLPTGNSTTMMRTGEQQPNITELYKVSYAYLGAIGFGVTLVLGFIVSIILNSKCEGVDPILIHPVFEHKIFCCLPKSMKKCLSCGVEHEKNRKKSKSELKTTPDAVGTTNVDMIRYEQQNKGYVNDEEATTRI